jgi:VIT1/CCC1 family predicted Fe2+/Mn2+ transporter
MNARLMDKLLNAQRNEISEHLVYAGLARSMKDPGNRKVLAHISRDERRHYGALKRFTGVDVPPRRLLVFAYTWISRILGMTFGVKLMELGESLAQGNYRDIGRAVPALRKVARDEDKHEKWLLGMLDEEYLQYVSSIVLGINDALVELTGAMAGLTFALQNGKLVALAGIITGVAAALSMAASEYLSKRHEGGDQSPVKASVYTGIAYMLTVAFLVFPYLVHANPFGALVWMMVNAIVVILAFTAYIAVAKEQPFKSRFLEMAGLSMGVAVLSFGIGLLARHLLGVDVG